MGKVSIGHAGRAVAPPPDSPALGRFLHALSKEKIPFLIGGMTAAVLQGVPIVTTDIDFWIGAPEREHDLVLRICDSLGAKFLTDHVVEFPDGLQLNFAYSMGGLKSFSLERKQALRLCWLGRTIKVLSLEQLQRSKRSVGRPKDKVHLAYIRKVLAFRRQKKT